MADEKPDPFDVAGGAEQETAPPADADAAADADAVVAAAEGADEGSAGLPVALPVATPVSADAGLQASEAETEAVRSTFLLKLHEIKHWMASLPAHLRAKLDGHPMAEHFDV